MIKVNPFYIGLVFLVFIAVPSALAEDSVNDTTSIDKPKFYKEIEPDIHIDFSNDLHWTGLSTDSDYWQIRNGEGHFFLHAYVTQLNSATYDLNPLLDSNVGSEWVLRYKLAIDDYQQATSAKWSELLIGLSDTNGSGAVVQWGLGAGFLNGANIKFTNLMYDYGTYNNWHCCPMKGELTDQRSLPGKNKIFWVEYVMEEDVLTVRLFEDNEYNRLIEQKSVNGWIPNDIRFLRIFPLVEDNTVNGYVYGRIDDIKFYNHETTVYQIDKMPLPKELEPKTMDEMLRSVLGDDYVESKPESEFSTDVPEWLKDTVTMWTSGKIKDNEFYTTIKHLVENDRMLIEELEYAHSLDLDYKPQTISLPKDIGCTYCLSEDFITLKWELPDHITDKGSSAVVNIKSPDGKTIKLTSHNERQIVFRVTSEFPVGLYEIEVSYGMDKFNISPILVTDQAIPKIPFWVKYNSQKWADGDLPESEFVDSLKVLIQNQKIVLDPEIFVKEDTFVITPEEMLEKLFPTQDEIDEIDPSIWEYVITDETFTLSNMNHVGVQKILQDRTRLFDPIYNKYEVPFTMMQIFQFASNDLAKEFLEQQIWAKNVLHHGTISDDEISYSDYKYTKIFEQADMSGTSDVTGDCLYYMTVNTGGVVMDEAHFVQCVLNEKIIQVYLYEDYTSVDENFAFELMDIILRKINDTSRIESVKNILKLDNINTPTLPSSSPSTQPTPPPSNAESSSTSKPETADPEISGSTVGIQNFSCINNDFGVVSMKGQFINGKSSYEKVAVNIVIEAYDGSVLAQGMDYILMVNQFETRDLEGYVEIDEPYHKCIATIDWDKSI